MVTIKKGELNRIGFTLDELAICEDDREYRFVFISENSAGIRYEITLTPVNISGRLDVFEITEGIDLTFALDGYYDYEIYQTTQNNLVETGLIRVESENTETQTLTEIKNPQVYVKD